MMMMMMMELRRNVLSRSLYEDRKLYAKREEELVLNLCVCVRTY